MNTIPASGTLARIRTHAAMFGWFSAVRHTLLKGVTRVLTPRVPDFDAVHGTTTEAWVEVDEGGVPASAAPDAVRYVPTRPEVIRHIARTLPIRHEDYDFIDLGSGRGRTLLVASEFPFRRITGVEVSPEHHRVALENIDRYRSQHHRGDRIEALCLDVLDFKIPRRDLVVYMYQPFGGETFNRVIDNLAELDARLHAVFLCLTNQQYYLDLVAAHPAFRQLADHLPLLTDQRWVLFGNAKAAELAT